MKKGRPPQDRPYEIIPSRYDQAWTAAAAGMRSFWPGKMASAFLSIGRLASKIRLYLLASP